MKINNIGQFGVNPYKQNVNKLDAVAKGSKTADKIEISNVAKELQQTPNVVAQRQERIDEITVQIENGTYRVNTNETAKSILDFYSKK